MRPDRIRQACWINTDADGAYLLHAYVDEPIPASLQPFARDPIVVENFSVPSGRLYFTGAEYGFRENDAFLRKHPHMGGSCSIPPGLIGSSVFRMEYPEGLQERLLKAGLCPAAASSLKTNLHERLKKCPFVRPAPNHFPIGADQKVCRASLDAV
jgi:hypothetical protein